MSVEQRQKPVLKGEDAHRFLENEKRIDKMLAAKIKDGLVLMYVKDNIIYPVALTQEQVNVFEVIQQVLPQPIKVMTNMPIGEAINLAKENKNND